MRCLESKFYFEYVDVIICNKLVSLATSASTASASVAPILKVAWLLIAAPMTYLIAAELFVGSTLSHRLRRWCRSRWLLIAFMWFLFTLEKRT